MPLPRRYDPSEVEPRLDGGWQDAGTYRFESGRTPVYSIDTPPATVSGYLHLGSVYSYSHADFIARFRRMRGDNVFYPMGYDDNGLATERLVERETGKTAEEMGRDSFIQACLEVTKVFEREYEALWRRLGLSVDWRYTYRTIDDRSREASQRAFLDLLRRGLAYRRKAPAIWCPHCHTAIAQAEVNDLDRQSEFLTISFGCDDGTPLEIGTTRPELMPACVAVFVHPDDDRYRDAVGHSAQVPLFDLDVPVLADPRADPGKGTGAVMCCTFGDTVDVEWWYAHDLPLREVLNRDGHLTDIAGNFAGLASTEARVEIVNALDAVGAVVKREQIAQTVRVHERCDTPVEYIVTNQWFIRLLDHKEELLAAGDVVAWHPESMHVRYRDWVENLQWDWCVSRQRFYGVPFPIWYCSCGKVLTADESQLPVDPVTQSSSRTCTCGNASITPEEDVMDTWATSAVSPQIAGRQLDAPEIYGQVFPFSLRPQGHDIIRTWTFDTIALSWYRYRIIPWKNLLISGWGVAGAGGEKISKSRGGGPVAPMEMLEQYSADAARYWAASAGPGKDAVISEEKFQNGSKFVTKLWNLAVFSERFLAGYEPPQELPLFSPADRWLLSSAQMLIRSATSSFESYEYARAKSEIESYFWSVLANNYVEMAKKRLYDDTSGGREAARYALYSGLRAVVILLAPIIPFVAEEIYRGLLRRPDGPDSVHRVEWPRPNEALVFEGGETTGEVLVGVANVVRRFKSDRRMSLGANLRRLHVQPNASIASSWLVGAEDDIGGVTRAEVVTIGPEPDDSWRGIAAIDEGVAKVWIET